MKGKAEEPSSERAGTAGSPGVQVSGRYCRDVDVGPGRRDRLALGFRYSFLLGILKEQGIHIDTATVAVPKGGSATPQGELSKEGERSLDSNRPLQ